MRHITAFLALLSAGLAAGPDIIPRPVSIAQIMDAPAQALNGAKVVAPAEFATEAALIRAAFPGQSSTVIRLEPLTGPAKTQGFEVGPEGYDINCEPGRDIIIQARTRAGFFYAYQTLLQATYRGNDGKDYLPPGRIWDKPRFAWRGLMLDEGRHFFGKEKVKRLIDLMALHKLNVLHWHLTEDQGWRVEIKKWPKLTTVGSVRAQSHVLGGKQVAYDGNKFDGKPYRGFHTQDDLREIVAYAAARHIQVVPEIEMPGHAAAAIAAYPQFGNDDIPGYAPKVMSRWGVHPYTFSPKEETFAFLDDILAELAPIFPSAYFHIGGDEAPKDQWKNSAFAQSVIKREGLKNEYELQSYFIRRIEKLLAARGKKLVGWDEIQEGGLSKTATMMVWRDWKWAKLAADNGNDVIMAPTSHTYFDYSPGKRGAGPQFGVIGGNLTLEKVYSFEPIPGNFTPEQHRQVLGTQGQLWSEYLYGWNKVEYMAFPRACALAEVAWSPKEGKDWNDFQRRLGVHLRRLDALKVNYHREDGSPAVTDRMGLGE